tara:strand:- start:218 stop:811 length:594 start_codon:yes stop_codon:yes gene_type:complete
MIKINKILNITIFLLLFLFTTNVESKILSIGNPNAKVTVKVFSSLTCPHCAIFHKTIFEDLKKDFIDKGLVKFEHHAFPLNLPALNAEIIVRCHTDNEKKFKLLEEIYEKQNIWAVGSDMKKINEALKKIGSELNLGNEKMDECLKNDKAQDDVLNQKIQARKKYKIEATPTIIINEKEYTDKVDYNKFKKAIEKKL